MSWRIFDATCACGCGRPVGSRDRRANARAQRARKRVEQMETRGFASSDDEYHRAFLFEGISWRNQYVRVVHGELKREELRSDEAWTVWRRGSRIALREGRRGLPDR